MPNWDAGVGASSGSYIIRLNTSENTNYNGNYSTVSWSLQLIRTGSGYAYSLDATSYWYVNIGGYAYDGYRGYDFRNGVTVVDLASGTTGAIYHDANGSKTITVRGYFSGGGGFPLSTGDTGSPSWGLTNFNYAAGTPAAPTAAIDTSTTQLATTAFVTNQAAAATSPMDGTAAVGTSKRYARQDHVHPTDTTRAPLASPALTGTATAVNLTVSGTTTLNGTNALASTTSIGNVDSTEISYLEGTTSNVQTQINTKTTQIVGYKDTGTTAIGGNATKKVVIASPNVAGTAPNAAGYTAAEGDLWFW